MLDAGFSMRAAEQDGRIRSFRKDTIAFLSKNMYNYKAADNRKY